MTNNKETNTYSGLDIFQPLRKSQTGFRVELSLSDYRMMDEWIRGDIEKSIPKITLFSKGYIQQRIDFILFQIHTRVGRDYKNVKSFSAEDGIYRFFDSNGKELYRANLLKLWNESGTSFEKLMEIQQKTKEEEEGLREILQRESLLGGSVVIQYAVTGTIGALAGSSVLSGTINGLNGISLASRRVKSIWVKNPSGLMERVPLGDMVFQGSSDWIRSNTLRILEKIGVYYNPITKTCINVGATAIKEMIKGLEKITFPEFRKKYGLSISEIEFQKFKTQIPEFLSLMKSTGNSVVEMTKWATKKGLHIIMFPVFFSAFQRQSNSATLTAGIIEMLAFNQGAKIGGGIGKYLGPLGKGLGPIVGGITGVVGTEWIGSKMDVDIEKWKVFNGRDMFSSKSSVIIHFATGWGVSEYFDSLNDWFPNSSAKIGSNGGFDVGIPSIDWGKYLPESWAKKGPIGKLTGGTGVTPDIDFYKRKVNFTMNPWEWFNASVKGRTVDKWNEMVDFYRKDLLKCVAELLGVFHTNKYPFNVGTFEEKKKVLEDRLKLLLMPVGNSMFQQQANSVILLVLSEVSHWNKDTSIGFLQDSITNYISYMRIDDTFIHLNQMKIDSEKESLQAEFLNFSNQIKDPQKKAYILSIYTRATSGRPIFNPDRIVTDDNPFSDGAHTELSQEHKMFNSILDSRETLDYSTVNHEGVFISQKIEARRLFSLLLERLSLHSQLISFQKRIKDIDTSQNAGEFIEIETIQKLIH